MNVRDPYMRLGEVFSTKNIECRMWNGWKINQTIEDQTMWEGTLIWEVDYFFRIIQWIGTDRSTWRILKIYDEWILNFWIGKEEWCRNIEAWVFWCDVLSCQIIKGIIILPHLICMCSRNSIYFYCKYVDYTILLYSQLYVLFILSEICKRNN